MAVMRNGVIGGPVQRRKKKRVSIIQKQIIPPSILEVITVNPEPIKEEKVDFVIEETTVVPTVIEAKEPDPVQEPEPIEDTKTEEPEEEKIESSSFYTKKYKKGGYKNKKSY